MDIPFHIQHSFINLCLNPPTMRAYTPVFKKEGKFYEGNTFFATSTVDATTMVRKYLKANPGFTFSHFKL